MLQLNNLESLVKKRKRRGRGGCRGGTSLRGHKGQKARTGAGGELKPFFEGGQMSLTRRLPRRGFTNRGKKEFATVSLFELESHFEPNTIVSVELLKAAGLVKGKKAHRVKVLGNGSLSIPLTVQVHACTQRAYDSITKSGGSVELVGENSSDRTTA